MRVFFDEWDIDLGQKVPVRLNVALTARAGACEHFLITTARSLLH